MDFHYLDLPGPVLIEPGRIADERGYFSEIFREDLIREHIGQFNFVQENQSLSVREGTVRGLHFQIGPFEQGKLVRCLAGRIFDVVVDLRRGSPHFGKWVACELSADKGNQIWIPPGFAHGFCTLEPDCVVCYKVTAYYNADCDCGVRWNDPEIGIDWPDIADPATLSGKDQIQPTLAQLPTYFSFKE